MTLLWLSYYGELGRGVQTAEVGVLDFRIEPPLGGDRLVVKSVAPAGLSDSLKTPLPDWAAQHIGNPRTQKDGPSSSRLVSYARRNPVWFEVGKNVNNGMSCARDARTVGAKRR